MSRHGSDPARSMRIVGGGMADRVLTNVKPCVRSHPVQMADVRDIYRIDMATCTSSAHAKTMVTNGLHESRQVSHQRPLRAKNVPDFPDKT